MKLSHFQSKLASITAQRNGYLVLSAGLLLLSLFLTLLIFIFAKQEKIVLVPPMLNRPVVVSEGKLSINYLEEITLMFAAMFLNKTPSNTEFNNELILKYVDPKHYDQMKSQLVRESDYLKKQNISSVFYPVSMKVDTKQASVILTGDLKLSVGEAMLPAKQVTYRIQYSIQSLLPLIAKFEEIKHV